jgi:hypothetical protein
MNQGLSKLEIWLDRTIRNGHFRGFPPYFPLRERVGRHPEDYARTLLDGLRNAGRNGRAFERARDDCRAFRSWAESTRIGSPRPGPFETAC